MIKPQPYFDGAKPCESPRALTICLAMIGLLVLSVGQPTSAFSESNNQPLRGRVAKASGIRLVRPKLPDALLPGQANSTVERSRTPVGVSLDTTDFVIGATKQQVKGGTQTPIDSQQLTAGMDRTLAPGATINANQARTDMPIFAYRAVSVSGQGSHDLTSLERRQLVGVTTDMTNSRLPPGDPDIHFWHNGNVSNLLVKNGARMTVHGTFAMGVGPDDTCNVEATGVGSRMIGREFSKAAVPEEIANPDLDYNGGGLVANGPVEFNCRYFKSDDELAARNARINAGRIDLGKSTTYPGGKEVLMNADHGNWQIKLPKGCTAGGASCNQGHNN